MFANVRATLIRVKILRLIVATLFCCGAGPAFGAYQGDEAQSLADLLQVYGKAVPALENHYQNSWIVEEHKRFLEADATESRQVEYRGTSDSARIDLTSSEGKPVSRVIDSRRAFVVARPGEGEPYVIDGIKRQPRDKSLSLLRAKVTLPFAPTSILDLSILEFMQQPGFEVTRAGPVSSEDGDRETRLQKVEWRIPATAPSDTTRAGWFVFDLTRGWILREYGFTFDETSPSRRMAIVHYKNLDQKFPDVESVEFVRDKQGVRTPLELVSLKQVLNKTPAAGDFSLLAFGIPEEADYRGSPFPVMLLVGAVALVALLLGIYMKTRLSRLKGA